MRSKHPSRRAAFSLVEALMASILLLAVVLAVSQALVAGQLQIYDAAHRAHAVELAEALMQEILRLPYADPDGEGESGRAAFDNLADFADFTESAPLTDAAGNAYADAYQVFSRTVAVVPGSVNVAQFGGTIAGLTVTVTVADPTGTSWEIHHFVPEP